MVSEIQAGQTFPAARPPAHPDIMGENNIPKALKGWGKKHCVDREIPQFHLSEVLLNKSVFKEVIICNYL